MPIPISPWCWVCFIPATSVSKPLVERRSLDFIFPADKWQCCKAFLSEYSFPFSSRLAE